MESEQIAVNIDSIKSIDHRWIG